MATITVLDYIVSREFNYFTLMELMIDGGQYKHYHNYTLLYLAKPCKIGNGEFFTVTLKEEYTSWSDSKRNLAFFCCIIMTTPLTPLYTIILYYYFSM